MTVSVLQLSLKQAAVVPSNTHKSYETLSSVSKNRVEWISKLQTMNPKSFAAEFQLRLPTPAMNDRLKVKVTVRLFKGDRKVYEKMHAIQSEACCQNYVLQDVFNKQKLGLKEDDTVTLEYKIRVKGWEMVKVAVEYWGQFVVAKCK